MRNLKDYSINEDAYKFLKKVLLYLKKRLGNNLSLFESYALIGILVSETIRISKSEFTNDPLDPNKIIDTIEASAIVSVLCTESNQSPEWFKSNYLNLDKTSIMHNDLTGEIMKKLKS